MARLAISLGAAAIGNLIAPGIGGQIGFALGSVAANYAFSEDPPTIYGPKIEDGRVTSSAYGQMIPIAWGTVSVSGNIIDAGPLNTVPVEDEQSGKGGPTQTIVTYTQYMDMDVALAQSADGIVQIYANETLIYDASPSAVVQSLAWLQFVFYDGSETQQVDPTFEAIRGVGNVPAYRGISHVVFKQFNVTAFNTTAINFRFVITSNGTESISTWEFEQYASTLAEANEVIHNTFSDLMIGVTYRQTGTTNNQQLVAIEPYTHTQAWTASVESDFYGYATWVDSFSFPDADISGIPLYSPNQFIVVDNSTFPGGPNPRDRWARMFYAESGIEFGHVQISDSSSGPILLSLFEDDAVFYQPIAPASLGNTTMKRHAVTSSLGLSSVSVTPPAGYFWASELRVVNCTKGKARNSIRPLMIGFFENSTSGDIAVSVWTDYTPGFGATTIAPSFSTPEELTDQPSSVASSIYDESLDVFWVLTTNATGEVIIVKVDSDGVIQNEINWNTDFSILASGVSDIDIDQNSGLIWLIYGGVAYSWPSFDITAQPTAYGSSLAQAPLAIHPETGTMVVGDGSEPTFRQYRFGALTGNGVSLQTVVENICDEPGTNLLTSDRTAAALSGITVQGFSISRIMQRRAAIQELASAYLFDMAPRSGVITAIVRGGSSSITLDDDTIGAHVYGSNGIPRLTINRLGEESLPKSFGITFIDADQNYEAGYEEALRLASSGGRDSTLGLGVVLTHDEAAQLANVLMHLAHIEAETYEAYCMPSVRSDVIPANIVTADIDGTEYPMFAAEASIVDGGIIALKGMRHDASIYTDFSVGGDTRDRNRGIEIAGATMLWPLDIPALRDADETAGLYFAASSYSPTWNGCNIFDSSDGVSYSSVGTITSISAAGFLTSAIPAPLASNDLENTITVQIVSGELSSTTHDVMQSDETINLAAIGSAGSWEIVRFQTATDNGNGSYDLSILHRGLRDTLPEASTHAIGDRFVVLSTSTLRRTTVQTTALDSQRYYKGVTIGQSVDATVPTLVTPTGQALKPFAPCLLDATGGSPWELTWHRQDKRRARFLQQPQMSEETESYSIDILDLGGIVLNTYTSSTESFTYGTGQQTTDFGGTVSYLKWRVAQSSSVVGLGDYAYLSSGVLSADYDGIITARGTLVEFYDMTDTTATCGSYSGSHDGTYTGTYTHGQAGLVDDGSTCVKLEVRPQMRVTVSSWAAADTIKSVEFWINIEDLPTEDAELARRQDTSGTKWWKSYIRASDKRLCFEVYDSTQKLLLIGDALVASQTYHIVINFGYATSDPAEMFINARSVASGTNSGSLSLSNNGNLDFGYNFGTGTKFDGRCHKLAFYNTALTGAEIYTDASTGFGP